MAYIATGAGTLKLSMKDRLKVIGARIAGAAIRTNKQCPDKNCRTLAARPLIGGFVCIGRLANPTDHILKGVNDLSLCFEQNWRRDRWHLNRYDFIVLHDLIIRAFQADEEKP